MSPPGTTCWTVIRAAAAGSPDDRDEVGRRYLGVVRSYLADRWRGSALRHELDDAVQDVFIECFREGGALEAAGGGRVPSFRAFLYGVVRNVARRSEVRSARTAGIPMEVEAGEDSLSRLFERAWARSIMAEAARLQRQRAEGAGDDAVRRVELLRLRFEEDLPIRTIAVRWGIDPAGLHRAYARARGEFREALLEVVAFHHPGTAAEVQREAADLLKSLSR
jgi:DNA-directed RNA polymerase specialized sigma24 family protein